MNLLIVALACFLLVFCVPRHAKHAKAHAHLQCVTINDQWDAANSPARDDFVKTYPAAQQRRVLKCLEQRGQ